MEEELLTPRLRLRRWRDEDEAPIAAISAEPEVARYLNPAAGPFVPRFVAHWREHGFGLWAVEPRDVRDAVCIGFVGIAYPKFLAAVAHRPEIGWRLGSAVWGRGLGTEAAIAARDYALDELGLPGLISIIHPQNRRSQRVAEKLGMSVTQHVHSPTMGIPVQIWSLDT
ncbi:MAG TPA: GNAT family N-acetyltransferase [Solirubrobacteraceae bacterium]|nr:GNAT family N-acetyltransferase [Solirubrobacteraceae bacterium]